MDCRQCYVSILVLFAVSLASSTPKATTKISKYQAFSFPRPLKISDDELIIKNVSTFVRNHSRAGAGAAQIAQIANRAALRMTPYYYDIENQTQYYVKFIDMMKQSIYATQDRIKYVTPILEKFESDRTFRGGFVFSKLDQLLDDMRRIYSYALKDMHWKTIEKNIIYFRHLTKKNIDITYMVEFMHSFHESSMKTLSQYSDIFATDLVKGKA